MDIPETERLIQSWRDRAFAIVNLLAESDVPEAGPVVEMVDDGVKLVNVLWEKVKEKAE